MCMTVSRLFNPTRTPKVGNTDRGITFEEPLNSIRISAGLNNTTNNNRLKITNTTIRSRKGG
jgi:hypothetical protein